MHSALVTTSFGLSDAARQWLAGAGYIASVLLAYLAFGWQPAVGGTMLAFGGHFLAFRPLTAMALGHWNPNADDEEVGFSISPRARLILVALWAATLWTGAALTAVHAGA